MQQHLAEWPNPDSSEALDDPLLDCLLIICRISGRPTARDGLRTGLPLVDHRLTPRLFPRAARRAGLATRLVRRKLRRISELVLPAVLLLKDGQACILVGFHEDKLKVIWPESGVSEDLVAPEVLDARYTGYAFFIKPEYRSDERVIRDDAAHKKHWFWGTFVKGWRIYRDVAIASLLINILGLAGVFFILNVYDRVVPNEALETLWVLASGMIIVYIFEALLKTLRGYFLDLAAKQADISLSARISEKVLGLSLTARPASVGSFATQIQEFGRLRDFITSASLTTVIDLPFIVLFLWVLHWLGGWIFYIPIIGMLAVGLYALLVQRAMRRSTEGIYQVSAQRHATLVEGITGLETIKAFGGESQYSP